MRSRSPARRLLGHGLTALTVAAVIFTALPLYWMVVTSFKPSAELYGRVVTWLPQHWTLESYRRLFVETKFPLYFWNSVAISAASTAIAVVFGCLAAYALSRFRNPAVVAFGRIIIGAKTLPTVLIALPLYLYMVDFGLVNTRFSLILANICFTLPLGIWLMKPYFDAVPIEIEESAWVDGEAG